MLSAIVLSTVPDPDQEIGGDTPAGLKNRVIHKDENKNYESGSFHANGTFLNTDNGNAHKFFVITGETCVFTDENQGEVTVTAGDCIVVPSGSKIKWDIQNTLKGYYFGFNDPQIDTYNDKSPEQSLIKISPTPEDDHWVDWPRIDQIRLIHGTGEQRAAISFTDPSERMICGVWEAPAYTTRPPKEYGAAELSYLLAGGATITMPHKQIHANSQEGLFIPLGLPMCWRSSERVRKYFCLLKG